MLVLNHQEKAALHTQSVLQNQNHRPVNVENPVSHKE